MSEAASDDRPASDGVVIRRERPDDAAAIYDLTARAFAPMPYSEGDEQDLIDTLRACGALAVSLVAEANGTLVGHLAFSPATAADGSRGWYALGPVSVEPQLQNRRIGTRLIETGLGILRADGAAGCILVGNATYYARFGFVLRPDLAPEGYPAEHFMVLTLGTANAMQVVDFHPAFRSSSAPLKEAADE